MENVTTATPDTYEDVITTATTPTTTTTRLVVTTLLTTTTTEKVLIPLLGNKITVLLVLTITLVPACCILLCCIRACIKSRARRTHPLVPDTKRPQRRRATPGKGARTRPALTKSYVNTWSVAE